MFKLYPKNRKPDINELKSMHDLIKKGASVSTVVSHINTKLGLVMTKKYLKNHLHHIINEEIKINTK